ncbi:ubiquinone biosynthesis regulatory protein kinase UbiB [Thalassomonas actiniarum]|uniref:Probable protein kinase UbiB n=1 Tax=Thalassomonas actiniarum TaxID=485447 RepID=A0AAE9YQH0_9GAMM|nr:ubiquinone biosynthesis regulatory protein kinase UbiB [Thalassomonas actiniarum]WDD98971.1 ubiquinone biosynthesis regulatory protein kinase UbiB [Thalassomonas actiniarum]
MNSHRLYQILKTFLQYGLDELLPKQALPWYVRLFRHSLFWLRNQHKDKPLALRFRLAIESLGPVFIKFGQMLSTRRDLLPPDFADELAALQDQVLPFDGEQAKQIIIKAMGEEAFNLHFGDFDMTPLASASIAQVHTASFYPDGKAGQGRDVVLKVLRPGISKTILADIKVMAMFAAIVARWLPDGKRLRPKEVVAEYRKTILDELDLMREAANAIQLKRNFEQGRSSDKVLYVPGIYSEYCHKNVLVMERIYGIGVGEIETLHQQQVNMKLLAERGVEVFFTQVFRDSFFHADMHPGNVFVDASSPEDPTWIAIDCGIVGTLNREDKRYLAENFVAFFNRDYRKVAQLHVDSGWVPHETSVDEFEFAIRTVCEPIFNKPLAEISFGQVLVNLFNTARRFNMEVQPQLVLLQKTLLYIEGLGRQLYPQLDLWQTAKPFLETWVKQQMGPKAILTKVRENLPFWNEKLPEMPDLVYDYLKAGKDSQIQQAKLISQLNRQQQQNSQKLLYAVFSGALIISATLLFIEHKSFPALILAGAGAGMALLALKKKPDND